MAAAGALGAPMGATFDRRTGDVTMTSGRAVLVVGTHSGLNPRSLRDLASGRSYADADYSWPGGGLPKLQGEPAIFVQGDGSWSVTFTASVGPLVVVQTFAASSSEPNVITEVIELRNPTNESIDTSSFSCGFTKRIGGPQRTGPDPEVSRFCNVPYRRHTETGELCDYAVQDLFTRQSWFSTARSPIYSRRTSALWGAEGWAWYQGDNTLLVTKYNPDAMEWSLLLPVARGADRSLRFGGAGRWKLGDPEGAARLAPLSGFRFGVTRYQILDGDWRAGYAAFRQFMEKRGNDVPANYDPPVHWNELYDNPLWNGKSVDTLANRQSEYRRRDMQVEADKAREIGCQCLYLDPGWDTDFGSTFWASDRLGTEESFVSWLRKDYGMALALHTPLAPWNNSDTYPAAAHRMNQDGSRAYTALGTQDSNISDLCTASEAYIEEKSSRLKELCRQGAYFLMFDGSWFAAPCWDPSHGHSLPLTRQEHLNAILRIAQIVHQAYPNVVIEQHDPMLGPGTPRYVPTYFMRGKPGAFNELWGFEYMNEPMQDILSHRAFSLYYYDLAYGTPIYLHITLKKDNANAMMLWWYASTCRHLGMGGKPDNPAVWEAQKQAMKQYLALKQFYTQGEFYGLDETIHCHTLASQRECVIDCFNLENEPTVRHAEFKLSEIGLPSHAFEMVGATYVVQGDMIEMSVPVPAMGHQQVTLRLKG